MSWQYLKSYIFVQTMNSEKTGIPPRLVTWSPTSRARSMQPKFYSFARRASYWAPLLNSLEKPRILRDIERLQGTARDRDLLNGLTLIPAWITNHMPISVWDEITYPVPNFSWNLGMDKNFMPHFAGCLHDYLSMLGLRLIHGDKTCKRALGYQSDTWTANTRMIWKLYTCIW